MIRIQSFTGTISDEILAGLAGLRIGVFRDWPYLYDGSMKYEVEYLRTYIDSPESIIVIAFDGDRIIGASTGIPLEYETWNVQKPWLDRAFDIGKIFYCGESVLLKDYRGKGIGVQFFEHREAWARELNRFDLITFCGVVRPDDHPLRPAGYVPLDKFWEKRGYTRTQDLVCYMSWKDLADPGETQKPLHFWTKKLGPG